MSDRKIESGRYRQRMLLCLDYDSGGYNNSFAILDGVNETGITYSEAGHSAQPGSHKRTVFYNDKEYPNLKSAVIAYEDRNKVSAGQSTGGTT